MSVANAVMECVSELSVFIVGVADDASVVTLGVILLFVSVSVPAIADNVPVVGSVTLVAAVVVIVTASAPASVKLPEAGVKPVTAPAVKLLAVPEQLVNTPALGVPMSGVVRVMPASVKAAELLFKATSVVPIYVDELLAALSPVLEPETDTAPAPMVKTDVLATFAVNVSVPVFTVNAVVSVAFVTVAALPLTLPVIVLVTVKSNNVPTLVRDEARTVDFNVLPERVLASAVTVIFAEPSKDTPFIVLAVVKVPAEPVVF